MNPIVKSLLAAATVAVMPLAAHAIVFNTVTSSSANDTLSAQNVAGHLFTANALINISEVGVYDAGGDGLGNAATVQIIKAGPAGIIDPFPGSSVVATYTVAPGASTDGYTYSPTEPGGLVLGLGIYAIMVTSMSDADLIADGLDLPSFSSTGLTFNTDIANYAVGVFQRYKVANFVYTVVPEPETYAVLAGAGLGAFGVWRRRR